jgi:hypothetical protein
VSGPLVEAHVVRPTHILPPIGYFMVGSNTVYIPKVHIFETILICIYLLWQRRERDLFPGYPMLPGGGVSCVLWW